MFNIRMFNFISCVQSKFLCMNQSKCPNIFIFESNQYKKVIVRQSLKKHILLSKVWLYSYILEVLLVV